MLKPSNPETTAEEWITAACFHMERLDWPAAIRALGYAIADLANREAEDD